MDQAYRPRVYYITTLNAEVVGQLVQHSVRADESAEGTRV
jgi:hypothetical protein